MSAGPVVWLGGRDGGAVVDAATAGLHWSDHGITVGDGVFETLKLVDGAPFARTRHLRRLADSAAGLGLELPPVPVLDAAVDATAAAWGTEPGRLRVTVTAGPGPMGSSRGADGPTLLVTAGPMVVDRSPTDVVVVPWTRNEHGALAGLKTTSYAENVVALARAEAAGASEALFANTAGMLCEGTGTNVFVAVGDRLVTPPLSSGCLAGIARELVIESSAVVERPLPYEVLATADEVFLTSSIRDVQAVSAIDDRRLVAPGPRTLAAAEAYHALLARDLDP
jgi:branched-chain amino acid aminotransferase